MKDRLAKAIECKSNALRGVSAKFNRSSLTTWARIQSQKFGSSHVIDPFTGLRHGRVGGVAERGRDML